MTEEQHIVVGKLSVQSDTAPLIEDPLMLKDIWHVEDDLGMHFNRHESYRALHFGDISQDWFKDKVKCYILFSRNKGNTFGTLAQSLAAFKKFALFLDAACIFSFNAINNEVFNKYYSSIQQLAESTQDKHLMHLKLFFGAGNSNNCFNVSTYWFNGKTERRKPDNDKIKYIPDEILRQLDENLHLLAKPLQRMVILIRALGLRAGELLQMRFNCLRQRRDGEWEISFINWKFNERLDTLPITPELAAVIKEQQDYIRSHLGTDFEYLFCSISKGEGLNPKPKVMTLLAFNKYLNELSEQYNICDSSGDRWRFTSHQFRRTVATKMTNEGVRQYIIQRYLRHDNPDMMQHYASIFPATIKEQMAELHKQKKIVDVTGTEVSLNHPELEDEAGLQWLRSKMQPKALAMGFCAKPQLLKPCLHANACLSCNHYRLDEDDLPALKQHLERNQKLKTESERLGYVRQLKGIEEDTTKIVNLIKALEN
jgi:integrase